MTDLLAAGVDMPDTASIGLFIAATVGLGIIVAVVLPRLLRSLRLAAAVTVLSLIGPTIALASALTGVGMMAVTGHAVQQLLVIAAVSALTAVAVAHRLTRPIANDLDMLSAAIRDIAKGDRSVEVRVDRHDQIGGLAGSVNQLSSSLRRAEDERDASDQERQAVICSLSHDLRTPLASLLASVDALDDDVGDPAHHRQIVRRNVLTMKYLVDDLFLLARADSGHVHVQCQPIDIAELVDEAADALEAAAAGGGVGFDRSGLRSVWAICDPEATGRLLRNVVENAVRHTPTGGVVSLSVDGVESEIDIIVEDEGPGFPPDFVARAFERFSQADPARSAHGGAGLGLAISRSLAEAQGGRIAIDSARHGRVRISLPADKRARSTALS